MRGRAEVLALRREVLLARSTLLRLRIARDAAAVRSGFTLARAGLAVARSAPAREVLLGLLLAGLGGGRASRWLSLAGRGLVLARAALAAAGWLRDTRRAPPEPAGPPAPSGVGEHPG